MNNNFSPRRAAHASLISIEKNGRYSNLEIDSMISQDSSGASDADKALYTRLVYGVTERRLTLDYIISYLSSRKLKDIDPATLTSIRLGLYQLIYTDRIPDFAAVSETVDTAPSRSRGFVNGVLRTFLRKNKKFDLPNGTTPEALSVGYSVSADICRSLSESYGAQTAEEILASLNAQSRICLKINTCTLSVSDAEELLKDAGVTTAASKYCGDVLCITNLTDAVRHGIERGDWFVQDEASRICTLVLGAKPSETVADTCSAPGGKAFSAAMDMKGSGRLFAFDLHENKISLIKKGAERLGLSNIEASCRDAGKPSPELYGLCDRVLCDAPCSGFGVLSKKPDIRYKNLKDFARLPDVQYRVLCGAAEYVKQGGILVYSTCTLNRRENEEVVQRFIAEHGGFSPCDFTAGELSSNGGMLTLFPHITETDGFFIAKMTKVK